VFVVLILLQGKALTHQQGAGFALITEKFTDAASWKLGFIYGKHAEFAYGQLGIPGLFCLATGFLVGWKIRAVRWVFILPGICSFLFYGWMHFPNWRYLQESLILLAPVAGLGAFWWVTFSGRRLGKTGARWCLLAVALALVCLTLWRARLVTPWGVPISRAQVTTLERSTEQVLSPGAPVLFDTRPVLAPYATASTDRHALPSGGGLVPRPRAGEGVCRFRA